MLFLRFLLKVVRLTIFGKISIVVDEERQRERDQETYEGDCPYNVAGRSDVTQYGGPGGIAHRRE
jgi:hypothetical protein